MQGKFSFHWLGLMVHPRKNILQRSKQFIMQFLGAKKEHTSAWTSGRSPHASWRVPFSRMTLATSSSFVVPKALSSICFDTLLSWPSLGWKISNARVLGGQYRVEMFEREREGEQSTTDAMGIELDHNTLMSVQCTPEHSQSKALYVSVVKSCVRR